MILVKLREAIKAYRRKHGLRFTHETLSAATAAISEASRISKRTLTAIGSDEEYNTTLKNINTLCRLLDTTPAQLLEYIPDDEIPPTKESRSTTQAARKVSEPKRAKTVSRTSKPSKHARSARGATRAFAKRKTAKKR